VIITFTLSKQQAIHHIYIYHNECIIYVSLCLFFFSLPSHIMWPKISWAREVTNKKWQQLRTLNLQLYIVWLIRSPADLIVVSFRRFIIGADVQSFDNNVMLSVRLPSIALWVGHQSEKKLEKQININLKKKHANWHGSWLTLTSKTERKEYSPIKHDTLSQLAFYN